MQEVPPTAAVNAPIDMVVAHPAAPMADAGRIGSMDVLRGFALLGILVMNIQSFAMPGAAYINPTAYGNFEGADFWVWYVSHIFADQKFMTLFSMLFGAGIVLMTTNVERQGRSPAALHYRRMAWLILFGILHGYLLWYGDILFLYGVCGMLVYPMRRWRPGWLILVGVLVVSVASILSLLQGWAMQLMPQEDIDAIMVEMWQPTAETQQAEIAEMRSGFAQQILHRAPGTFMFQTLMVMVWGLWRAGGLMLIGMALFKLGVFSGRRSTRLYLAMTLIGACIGIPVILYGVQRNFAEDWRGEYSFFVGSQYNYWASLLVSLAWVGAVMLMCRAAFWRSVLTPIGAVGRMALTNYLMQTILCTLIFNGHGLGLFGRVERTGQVAIVLGVWAVQLIVSPLWLRRFQFGPFEWLWRSLTYFKLQPVRRGRREASPGGAG